MTMESGTPSQDVNLSLNIVAEAQEETTPKKPKAKRRKKINKYERRRRKAAAAKANKEGTSSSGEKQEEEEDEAPDGKEEKESQEQIKKDDKPPAEAAKAQLESATEGLGNDVSSASKEDGDDKVAKVTNSNEEDESSDAGDLPTTKSAADEEAHAAYMAEYHARPLELDRRSGATVRPRKKSRQDLDTTSEVFSQESGWKDLNLDPKIVNLLSHPKPTKIQEKVLHSMGKGGEAKNHWIQSETGSGKTLAYFLPVLQSLWQNLQASVTKDRASLGTQCLIICPTQELVQQTQQACEQLVTKLCAGQLVVGALRGQASRAKEKARIRKGLGVLVSTPGRLLDHLQTTVALQTAVRQMQWLVLDEVDRLFDMGLSPQLKQAIELLRQFGGKNGWRSTLVSATVPPEVKETVQELPSSNNKKGKTKWAWIQGGSGDKTDDESGGRSLPKQLVQYHLLVSAKLRLSALIAFLADRVHSKERTVVFLSTCASVDYYHELFHKMDCILKGDSSSSGIFGSACTVDRLHGNVPHAQRQSVLQSFTKPKSATNQQARILLATDVAARGLNLHTDWTVQYDPPCEIADYIHRAGRVARAGQIGQSLLFLLPSEKSLLGILQLKQQSEKPIPPISLTSTLQEAAKLCPDLTHAGLQRNGMSSRVASTKDTSSDSASRSGSRQGEGFCSELQYRLEECVIEQSKTQDSFSVGEKKKKKAKKDAPTTLLDMARAAFLSHMRAYPTKEKLVRHIFGARALHLGHIAKSFALREPPKTLVKNSRGAAGPPNNKKKRSANLAFEGGRKNTESDDEFASNGRNSAKKRALLMANAAKLQMGGVDDF